MLSEKMALRHGAKIVCVDVNGEGNAETVNTINKKKVGYEGGEGSEGRGEGNNINRMKVR